MNSKIPRAPFLGGCRRRRLGVVTGSHCADKTIQCRDQSNPPALRATPLDRGDGGFLFRPIRDGLAALSILFVQQVQFFRVLLRLHQNGSGKSIIHVIHVFNGIG